jgi:hypothetical protein
LIVAGWVLAGFSAVIPVLAIGAIICGGILIGRSEAGHGVGILLLGLILGFLAFLFWAAVLSA